MRIWSYENEYEILVMRDEMHQERLEEFSYIKRQPTEAEYAHWFKQTETGEVSEVLIDKEGFDNNVEHMLFNIQVFVPHGKSKTQILGRIFQDTFDNLNITQEHIIYTQVGQKHSIEAVFI